MSRDRAERMAELFRCRPDNPWLAYEVAKQLADDPRVTNVRIEFLALVGRSPAAEAGWREFIESHHDRRVEERTG